MTKTVKVFVLETTDTHTEPVADFLMDVPVYYDNEVAVQEAIREVERRGYKVIPNDQGGYNEYCYLGDIYDYIGITVEPEEEQEN